MINGIGGVRHMILLAAVSLCVGCAAAPPPNVVLITLDTTRADHLGCYGFARSTSPRLDALAAEGTVFENCLSPVPVTLPSHATIFTGTYPTFHGVRDNAGFELPEHMTTLAEVLRGRGYATAAFIGAFPLDSRFNLDQGFVVYDDDVRPPSGDPRGRTVEDQLFYEERKADDVTDVALEWLQGHSGGPFFAWLHYFDPHMPYHAPEPFSQFFADSPYAAEIAYMDDSLGRVLDWLRQGGLMDRTVVVVVGDHGEGLGQHRENTHGLTIYNSILKVPLIVRTPGLDSGRVPSTVQTIDVMPTVCELVGAPTPAEVQGSSLVPMLRGGPAFDRDSYFETLRGRLQYGWSPVFGLGHGQWKFIESPEPELYDLAQDPGETVNLVVRHTEVAQTLAARLVELREDIRSPRASSAAVWIDSETRLRLAALGYVGGDGVDKSEFDSIETIIPEMTSPHRAVGELMGRIIEVRNLLAMGNSHRALDILDTTLKLDPENPEALFLQFLAHYSLKHALEALASAKAYAEVDRGSPRALLSEGMALASLGRFEEAARSFRGAADANPHEADALRWLCFVLLQLGDWPAAELACGSAIELDPSDFETRSLRVNIFAHDRRFDAALNDLDDLIGRYPEVADLHHRMGVVLMELDRMEEARGALELALELDPNRSTSHFALALLERRAGEFERCRINLERVLELDPNEGEASAARAMLQDLPANR